MAYYHVEIAYRTKRSGTVVGMTVKAFDPDEAVEIARADILGGYPARQFAYSNVREATETDIGLGVINERKDAADNQS